MRKYNLIRNDQAPMDILAEKFKTDSKDYIFSKYDPVTTYDVVVAIIPVSSVVQITSEEIEAPKRNYKITMMGDKVEHVCAECAVIMEGDMVFLNYDGDYTSFTTVTQLPVNKIIKTEVVD
ncbi:hypothetical protein LAh9_17 [Aeromonas phage LAh_9]|uniref:Uncharacterized protein n=4 Tax=Lahexavirus TaxID=2843411 RepID=A0A514A0Z4_9CAUD|nr:hypothetical protein HWC29_gp092 [Aeromonas phage 4_4572]YP_009847327.1 hypothetical protein HWC30_gp153 [Aeromonas phage LAh_6]YP_009847384.1 hypothetical protein HWC31_gp046 [Aeromonas phage LAh_8]YP_009847498.1 hypothetical protein HWC32_gp017 [Aeromonas phage LAh_9]QDH46563.1 hypothetical protein LAh6_153 [Aeromonas phage LAh_6]QDH46797.1 hypothetical protein LAh8_46 [Aeromonas phage LAh_8]QDH46941.1 hypothetical protein LAh9_17 [Aeromonas phage LAh_9]QEG09094.1 hypothetical protein [